jgi:hypothetical protein
MANLSSILRQLKQERDRVERQLTGLNAALTAFAGVYSGSAIHEKRRISAAGRKRIAAAQRARWAKVKGKSKAATPNEPCRHRPVARSQPHSVQGRLGSGQRKRARATQSVSTAELQPYSPDLCGNGVTDISCDRVTSWGRLEMRAAGGPETKSAATSMTKSRSSIGEDRIVSISLTFAIILCVSAEACCAVLNAASAV